MAVSRGHRFGVSYVFSVNFLVNILANILFSVNWYLRKMTLGVTDLMFGNYRAMQIWPVFHLACDISQATWSYYNPQALTQLHRPESLSSPAAGLSERMSSLYTLKALLDLIICLCAERPWGQPKRDTEYWVWLSSWQRETIWPICNICVD